MTSPRNTVTGRIRLDVNSIRADAQQIAASARQAAAQVQRAFNTATTATDRALDASGRNAQRWATTLGQAARSVQNNFKGVGGAIQNATLPLAALGAAAGLVTVAGLRQADALALLNTRYVEITGSQAAAREQMDRIAAAARRVGVPVRQAQRDFAGLIPAVRDAGESIDDYVGLSLRLATLNQSEGLTGAVFAIREALSSGGTDLVSLAERFNLPRAQLRALIAETGSFSAALDITLDRQGATQAAADAQAQSLGALTAQIRDTVGQTLERLFLPALGAVRDALTTINNLLQATPDWLVGAGTGVLLAVGGFSAFALILEKVITAYGVVRTAALATNAAILKTVPALGGAAGAVGRGAAGLARGAVSLAPRALVGAGALAVGANAGIGLVNAFGRATNNEALANKTLDDVFTTFKQLIVVAVSGFAENVLRPLLLLTGDVVNIFRNFGDAMTIVFAEVQSAFGALLIYIGGIVEALGGAGAGSGFFDEGIRIRREAGANRTAAEERSAGRVNDNEATVDRIITDLVRGARDFVFPVEAASEAVAATSATWRDNLTAGIRDILAAQGDRVSAGFDERVRLQEELSRLQAEGDLSATEDRITSLTRERDAITRLLPELERYAAFSDAAADALAGYSDRLAEINATIPQFGDALRAASRRAFDGASAALGEAVREAATERDAALAKALSEANEALDTLNDEQVERQRDLREREAEVNAEYNEAEADRVEAHRRRLIDIERSFDRDSAEAASRLDAAGVAAAINRRQDELQQAEETNQDAAAANAEQLTDQQVALAAERAALVAYYEQRLTDIQTRQAAEVVVAQAGYAEQLATAQTAYAEQRQAIQAQLALQLSDIRQAQALERQARQEAYNALLLDAQAFTARLIEQGRTLAGGALAGLGVSPGAANVIGTAATTLGNAIAPGLAGLVANFTINNATDPEAVAQAVNVQLVRLAGGGR